MTIGMGAHGPNAGAAILQALASAEKICTGAIGGFVAAAAIGEHAVLRAETQRGGVEGLQFDTSQQAFESAFTAGLISSGPNRPAPLSAFVAAEAGTGVVSGHRMPNATSVEGMPMNETVLKRMADGSDPAVAVNEVIDMNPEADCGLIAVNCQGEGGAANTRRVTRSDAGMASGQLANASVWVLHNAVRPYKSLASLLVEVALETMHPELTTRGHAIFKKGCKVEPGEVPQIHINESDMVERIVVQLSMNGAVQALDIGCQPLVYSQGIPIARLAYEPFLVARDRQLLSADGESELQVAIGVYS